MVQWCKNNSLCRLKRWDLIGQSLTYNWIRQKGSYNWDAVYAYKIVALFAGLRQKHRQDLEHLTLTTQPFKTLKFFTLAVVQYLRQTISYILAKGGYLMLFSSLTMTIGILLVTFDGPHEKVIFPLGLLYCFLPSWSFSCFVCNVSFIFLHIIFGDWWYNILLQHVGEILNYVRYGMWWIALGVASSIGLGKFSYNL